MPAAGPPPPRVNPFAGRRTTVRLVSSSRGERDPVVRWSGGGGEKNNRLLVNNNVLPTLPLDRPLVDVSVAVLNIVNVIIILASL